ncbi:addiction module toxin RelE [Candidatus Micrarchaeota archaeon CG06_land_8_20_14_3_00_50_6]|nr:MAG: addiction module toxin RelE [Candidatus Micrarchaeota archaeon CG06_land_8_20_14_3_00_50_6]
MREFSVKEHLRGKVDKLLKKDKETYDALMGKMNEIPDCADVNHYKNLRKPMQHLKRVHVLGPFVLTFHYIESEDKIIFYDFDHHDKIYL